MIVMINRYYITIFQSEYLPILMIFTSWLVVGIPTPLKNDGVKVNWNNDIPNICKK